MILSNNANILTDNEIMEILLSKDEIALKKLNKKAQEITKSIYGNRIFLRGLIEFSNYCKQGCYYCGINRDNKEIERFRLKDEQILLAAERGYRLGFRTIVLQGGEDPAFTDNRMIRLIENLKMNFPDSAITLSLGIRSPEAYRAFKSAGSDRYLLRHESADPHCFSRLHTKDQSLEDRIQALYQLKELGFQVGTGFLVGAPGASPETYLKDIKLIRDLQPEMIGIGPFIPHHSTIFADESSGSVEMTRKLLSILRIENPRALIPSTTALNSLHPAGRILGILSGANVLMPNLNPSEESKNYELYDNKANTGLESANQLDELQKTLNKIAYTIDLSRGDYIKENK